MVPESEMWGLSAAAPGGLEIVDRSRQCERVAGLGAVVALMIAARHHAVGDPNVCRYRTSMS